LHVSPYSGRACVCLRVCVRVCACECHCVILRAGWAGMCASARGAGLGRGRRRWPRRETLNPKT